MKINSNLTLDLSNIMKISVNKNSSNIKNDNNKNNMNISINNTNENENNIIATKVKKFNLCKPYEFPNIHNESNNNGNWDSFRKNKILKFLFLNESNNERIKLLNYYKIKKPNINNNYFINTLKSNNLKNYSKIIENDNIDNNFTVNKDKDIYLIAKSIHSEKRSANFKTDKNKLKPLNLTIKSRKNNFNNSNIRSEKVIDNINNNYSKIGKKCSPINKKKYTINNTLINRKIKMNLSTEKNGNNSPLMKNNQNNSLLKNFYFSTNKSNNKNHANKLKATNNLLPYIDRTKLK